LSGYEPDEGDGAGGAFPVRLPGIGKTMSTREIGKYYTAELFHYLEFYHNCKRCGFPYASFLEAPAWVPKLLGEFDGVYEQARAHLMKPRGEGPPGRGGGARGVWRD
jgi:hypothetical protein